jgi:hypothetical protein
MSTDSDETVDMIVGHTIAFAKQFIFEPMVDDDEPIDSFNDETIDSYEDASYCLHGQNNINKAESLDEFRLGTNHVPESPAERSRMSQLEDDLQRNAEVFQPVGEVFDNLTNHSTNDDDQGADAEVEDTSIS